MVKMIIPMYPNTDETFRPFKDAECRICGIKSFAHIHRAGSKPKDFEKIEENSMSNSTQNDLKRARLVPIEVFGAEDGYGLCDAVSAWSDCNRADGMIFRLDDDFQEGYRNKEDTVEIWATQENITKLKTHFKKWTNQK